MKKTFIFLMVLLFIAFSAIASNVRNQAINRTEYEERPEDTFIATNSYVIIDSSKSNLIGGFFAGIWNTDADGDSIDYMCVRFPSYIKTKGDTISGTLAPGSNVMFSFSFGGWVYWLARNATPDSTANGYVSHYGKLN